ncbi:MAG: DNA-3-methyladenine glycosylase [Phycisphaeraceae bacterium]
MSEPQTDRRLPRSFFRRDVTDVAIGLLGQRLVRMYRGKRLAGVIVETEAYLGVADRAAHTFNGRYTERNRAMWLDGGHAYVYFTYGMHHCLNIVARCEGDPVAVLLRALEPTEGLETMRRFRGQHARRETDLCSGPAKLCQALAIDRKLDGTDMTRSGTLFIERARGRAYAGAKIVTMRRIGVDYAGEWAGKPLRFYVKDNPHVSRR